MQIFRVLLVAVWGVVVYLTMKAVFSEGLAASSDVFASDLVAGNWRAQFNADLLAHMLLMGVWVAWRQRFSIQGIVLALLCALGGSLVSFVYVLVLSFYHKGNAQKLLLGRHYQELQA